MNPSFCQCLVGPSCGDNYEPDHQEPLNLTWSRIDQPGVVSSSKSVQTLESEASGASIFHDVGVGLHHGAFVCVAVSHVSVTMCHHDVGVG